MLTITWNTGRLYTAEGQVMTARFDFDTGRVIFRDHSRMIAGVLREKLPSFIVGDRQMLRDFVDGEYLHNRYGYDREAEQLQRVEDKPAAKPAPVTILAVHLMASKRKTLCKLPARPFPEQASCPVGMWEAVKPEHRCPICDREYRLQCTLESLTGGEG